MGRLDEASAQLQRAVEIDPLSPLYITVLGYLSYARGDCDLAIRQQHRAMDLDGWLETGVEERDLITLGGLKSDPRYAPLQGHPRYQAMLRRMNLEP